MSISRHFYFRFTALLSSPFSLHNLIPDPQTVFQMASLSASPPATGSKINLQASHHLLSGALSGLSSAVVLQPLDLLKTRLQQSQGGVGSKR